MKKIIIVMVVCLIFACVVLGCTKTTNIEVSDDEISETLLLNEINNQINYKYLSLAFVEPDLTEQYENVVLSVREDEVEDYLIESKIIVENCKNLDIIFTIDEAEKAVRTEYYQIKQESSKSEYYDIILSILQENNITETEYLELMKSEAYYKYNKISFKNYFSTEIFDSSKSISLDEQFDDYINNLVNDSIR